MARNGWYALKTGCASAAPAGSLAVMARLIAEPKPEFVAHFQPPDPMPQSQMEARQLIESLRVGIAPAQHVAELTLNLRPERESLIQALNQAHQQGGAVRAVVGEYGYGKSHMVELATQEALARNFLVGTVSLDLLELPPHRGFAIYREALRHLRYPDTDERGLGPLLEKTAVSPRPSAICKTCLPDPTDPLVIGLQAFAGTASSRQRKAWQEWLMGGRRVKIMNKGVPRGVKFPSIYKIGHNARQMAYLLTAVSALARLGNYSGLCLLVDEAESYSLLRPYQRPKASLFFQAVIYAALRQNQDKIDEAQFPQHRWRSYPLATTRGSPSFSSSPSPAATTGCRCKNGSRPSKSSCWSQTPIRKKWANFCSASWLPCPGLRLRTNRAAGTGAARRGRTFGDGDSERPFFHAQRRQNGRRAVRPALPPSQLRRRHPPRRTPQPGALT
jgi:hypothetical protein